MTVRVGLVGAGMMGSYHGLLFSNSIANATLVAVSDPDLDRAQKAAGQGRAVTDYREIVVAPDVDAILVAAPDEFHFEIVKLALEQGKPVLCEKPLAATTDQCRKIVELERGRGLVTTGFMRRYDPAYVELREKFRRGDIGEARVVYCIHRNVAANPWMTPDMWFTNALVHELDICRWLLGIEYVHATFPRSKSRDPIIVNLETDKGATIIAETFLAAAYGYHVHTEIVGEHGTLSFGDQSLSFTRRNATRQSSYPSNWIERFADGYRLQNQAWIDSIVSAVADPNAATATDGLLALSYAEQLVALFGNSPSGELALPSNG